MKLLHVLAVKKRTAQEQGFEPVVAKKAVNKKTEQDHKVFAHHDKWGTFQVPKAFLNTNNNAPAAVAPKSVRQVSNTHGWHGARNMARANEQRRQQQQQKQKQQQQKQQQGQKQKQKLEQKQSKQQQQHSGGVETRVSSISSNLAGALSVGGIKDAPLAESAKRTAVVSVP